MPHKTICDLSRCLAERASNAGSNSREASGKSIQFRRTAASVAASAPHNDGSFLAKRSWAARRLRYRASVLSIVEIELPLSLVIVSERPLH
ncbi:unannotated protein [freshwater metagenome]|uniref:Unannotated protein n=1 Tax=freshwater metagenome TaxID=449393 RepID=A0A6J6M4W2_9ZZZZ